MDPKKHLLRRDRIRRLPKEGWSWIDRRFLREKAPDLDRDSILLYFFLAAASDKDGLSFFSDLSIAGRLRMTEGSLERSRVELERHDLIAYEKPLYQVLSIAEPFSPPPRRESEPSLIQDLFRELAGRLSADNTSSSGKGESA
jgi:hypothetical protein